MKRLLFFIFLFFSLFNAIAQENRGGLNISGQLVDADEKEPLVQATVQVFWAKDSTFVGGTVTDVRGNFSVQAPSNGIYTGEYLGALSWRYPSARYDATARY